MCFPTAATQTPLFLFPFPGETGWGRERRRGSRGIFSSCKKKSLNYCLRRKFVINLDSPTHERAVETEEARPDLGGHMRARRPRLLLKALPLYESQPTPP